MTWGVGLRRLDALDALRGIAALSVVLFHYTTNYEHEYGHTPSPAVSWPQGHYGVYLFFVISGFVIFMTVDRSERVRDFAVSRFTRLFPLYWCCVLLTWTVAQLAGPADRQVGLRSMLVNLSMLEGFVGVSYVDGVYWTLTVELSFYIGMALALALGLLKGRRLAVTLCVWWCASMVLRVLAPGPLEYVQVHTDSRYSHLFIAGMCFYLGYSRGWDRWKLIGVLQAVPVGLLESRLSGVVVAGILALFWLALTGRLPFLRWRPLTSLGLVSYALYLVHQNIGYAAMGWLEARGLSSNAAILLLLPLVAATAAVLTFRLERPFAKRLRRALTRTTPARGEAGAALRSDGAPVAP